MQLIKGEDLQESTKSEVLRAFIYRLTIENNYPAHNPCNASVKAITDSQWIKDHAFYVHNDGSLSKKHQHCEPSCLAD